MTRQDSVPDVFHRVNVWLSLNHNCRREMSGDVYLGQILASPRVCCLSVLNLTLRRDFDPFNKPLPPTPPPRPPLVYRWSSREQNHSPGGPISSCQCSQGTVATPPESHCQVLLPPLGPMHHTSHFDRYRITCGQMRYVF